jgi:hypothetical protein
LEDLKMPASDLIYLGRTGRAGSKEVMGRSFGREVKGPVDEGTGVLGTIIIQAENVEE